MRAVVLVALAGALASAPAAGQALSAFQREKVESLLASRLPCLGCHRLDGRGGAIGPDLSDVGARRPADSIYAMMANPNGVRPGTLMPLVPMPDATRRLVARYLASRTLQADTAVATVSTAPSNATTAAAGTDQTAALYARRCAACHGVEGRGDGWNATLLPVRPAALADPARMSALSDDRLFDTIFSGGYVMNRSNLMPPYGFTLRRDEIRALVRHIRALCRCEGPAWSR